MNKETKTRLIKLFSDLPRFDIMSLTKELGEGLINSPIDKSETAYSIAKERYNIKYETIHEFYEMQKVALRAFVNQLPSHDLREEEIKDIYIILNQLSEYLIRSIQLDGQENKRLIHQCLFQIKELEEELKLSIIDESKLEQKYKAYFCSLIKYFKFKHNLYDIDNSTTLSLLVSNMKKKKFRYKEQDIKNQLNALTEMKFQLNEDFILYKK